MSPPHERSGSPDGTRSTLALADEHAERIRFDRDMRRMASLIRWYDRGHESAFLRELRWREQGRIT